MRIVPIFSFLILAGVFTLSRVPDQITVRAEDRTAPVSIDHFESTSRLGGFELELETRIVSGGMKLTPPPVGSAAYLWLSRPLARAEVSEMGDSGIRYLGLAASGIAVVQRTEADWDLPEKFGILASALVLSSDRLSGELARALVEPRPNERELPVSVTLVFWPRASAGEVRRLLGEDMPERWDLPTDGEERIGEACFAHTEIRSRERVLALSESPLISSIHLNSPRRETNLDSRQQVGGDVLSAPPLGLDGSGVLVGQWDGGSVLLTHADFGGRVTFQDTGSVSSHSTHVAGTILGSGGGNAQARGFAPGATMISYNFNGDALQERRDALHTFRHELDNHSWGSGSTAYGTYDSTAMEFDLDARDLMSLAVKSAGNEGQSSQVIVSGYGYDSLDADSSAKNILVIGATEDSRALTSFSSRGPTDDGRIKPDVCANGASLTSTESNGLYSVKSGTSMSAPSTSGLIALLTQHYKALNGGRRLGNDISRALMIHTCDDEFHTGPDYRFGWGIVNGVAAANLISLDATSDGKHLVRGAVRQGQQTRYPLNVPAGHTDLKVTVAWLDAFNGSTSVKRLVHDLDLWLEDPMGNIHRPWSLDGANPHNDALRSSINVKDNVEQVLVDTPMAGTWEVVVQGTSITDPDLPVQGFVVASDLPLTRSSVRIQDSTKTYPVTIPDNSTSGTTFNFTGPNGTVKAVRVLVNITHQARGNLQIQLVHPDGTTVVLEQNDTSTRDDIWAVYPDLRSYDDDTTVFHNKASNGTWQLVVKDLNAGSTGEVRRAELEIDYEVPVNFPPFAVLPTAQTVSVGSTVTLDGRGSTDPDNDPLTYQWVQIGGQSVTFQTPIPGVMTFIVQPSLVGLTLIFQLTVADPDGLSDSTSTLVFVQANHAPTAIAGLDSSADNGQQVALSGAASTDPDGDPLTYFWTQISGSTISQGTVLGSSLVFNTPRVASPETLVFRLTVTDPGGLSHSDEVSVLVNGNRIPTANAGIDQSVGFGDAVTLHGHASSDPDGDALMYRWTQISGESVLLADEASVSASFTAPTQASDQVLEFEIEVMDGIGGVDTDRVVVSVHGTGVFDPVVSTISVSVFQIGEEVVISGSGLANASVTIDGVGQSIVSQSDTEIRFAVDDATPVGNSRLLRIVTSSGAYETNIDVESTPSGTTPSPSDSSGGSGGGGGGCQLSTGQNDHEPTYLIFLIGLGLWLLRWIARKRHIAQVVVEWR